MSNLTIAEFQGTKLSIIEHDGKKWLTSKDVGLALGYAEDKAGTSITNLYGRHEDEFTDADTFTIKLMDYSQRGNPNTRVFPETGCNMLGFFSNTPRAKEFRQWAKRVLAGQAVVAAAHTDARLDRVEDAVLQMAQGMQVLLKANNTTQKYIDLLETNQRGNAKVTYVRALECMRMVAGGYSQAAAARLMRFSASTLNQIIKDVYPISDPSGKPEGYDAEAFTLRAAIEERMELLHPHRHRAAQIAQARVTEGGAA